MNGLGGVPKEKKTPLFTETGFSTRAVVYQVLTLIVIPLGRLSENEK